MAIKKKQSGVGAAKALAHNPPTRRINLALQGGGSHGAFAWGVVDHLLEDGRVDFDGISGTSAGSMNAAALAYGAIGGKESARQKLHDFWLAISEAGNRLNPLGQLFCQQPSPMGNLLTSMASQFFWGITHTFSPYQLNPLNLNPLRDVLVNQIDFDALSRDSTIKLFLAATNVRTGKAKVFGMEEAITADMVMASACLPQLFQAVEVEGEHYWDGGFMGNPVLYPLIYNTNTSDVLIVHINPIERPGTPTTAEDILNRVNEITFNSSLIKELRAIHFVQKLIEQGWIKEEFLGQLKHILVHSIRADLALSDLSADSKFRSDWGFLTMLRDRVRACAKEWLAENFESLGVRSSVDLKQEFL